MIKKLKKEQSPQRKTGKNAGVIIDCEDIAIYIFPPPREHGRPHCHVLSKRSYKVKGEKREVYPEVKIYLDVSSIIVVTKGFSKRDLEIIGNIIFNDPSEKEVSNDEYLMTIWETLHGQFKKVEI